MIKRLRFDLDVKFKFLTPDVEILLEGYKEIKKLPPGDQDDVMDINVKDYGFTMTNVGSTFLSQMMNLIKRFPDVVANIETFNVTLHQ